MMHSIAQVLGEASGILQDAEVPEARRDAGALLSFVLGKDRTFLISHADNELSGEQLDQFRKFVARRATGEPLQYITGVQDFYGREFHVTPDVLIPRPETELLVEAVLESVEKDASFVFCDVGTGSGCIAVTLLCELPNTNAIAVDKSPAALEIAKLNASKHSVANRASFLVSDCFDSLFSKSSQIFLIVSNPPYVAETALADLQREVRDHEPRMALTPGGGGLSIIRRLLHEAPAFLSPGGQMFMEIGFDQAEAVKDLVDSEVWNLREIRPDLQRIPRIVILQKK